MSLLPVVLDRIDQLQKGPLHPEILKLKEEIAAETRILELRTSVGRETSAEGIEKIVKMKLELDGKYAAWIEGRL